MTRVLVAYASRHGGTATIAAAIAAALHEGGAEVVLRAAGEGADDAAAFDAIVLGSAVYLGRWQNEAIDLLKRIGREAAAPAVWLFSSGPVDGTSEGEAAAVSAAQLPPGEAGRRAARLGVRSYVTFGGRSGEEMSGMLARWLPKDDWRDFDAVRAWAEEIAHDLATARS